MQHYPKEMKAKAKKMYIEEGLKNVEIAEKLGVSSQLVSAWAKQNEWRVERIDFKLKKRTTNGR